MIRQKKWIKKKTIFLSVSVIAISFFLVACSTENNKTDKIKALMDKYHDIGQFHGAVLVSEGNNVLFKSGYGLANSEWNIPNDTETKFRIGSITKQFTAALILTLVDEGKLSLDQKISEILPEFRKDVGEKVSIHQLLCHCSGVSMPPLSLKEYDEIFQKKMTTKQIIEKLCGGDLAFEPGSKFQYSSAGYMVLGAIIEKITSQSYEEALQERILKPLKMKDTGVDDYVKILPKRASGYQTNFGIGNARFKYMPSSFSSGALYSTVEDFYKWFSALNSDWFLSPESRKRAFAKHIASHRGYYGYGWFVQDKKYDDSTLELVFHAGDVNGFSGIIFGCNKKEQLVALLTNQEGTHYYDIAYNLFNILNNVPADIPKKYVADILRHTIYSVNLEAALKKYSEIKNEGIENYNPDEDELIELGYDLLYADKVLESIEVLKITTQLHPDSYNAFDSLGEAYYRNNDTSRAIINYKKSLELNPDNKNAAKMIERIESENN